MTPAQPDSRHTEGIRSLEVRWILPGQLAAAVTGWFGRFPAGTKLIEDAYLLDPHLPGLSVKVRGRRALEVKAYRGSPGLLEVLGCARGRLESWQKWSFPHDPPSHDSCDPVGWRPVIKRRRISWFSLAGGPSRAARGWAGSRRAPWSSPRSMCVARPGGRWASRQPAPPRRCAANSMSPPRIADRLPGGMDWAWGATVVTCVSLAVFILAGQPGGGQHTPVSKHWLSAALACCAGAAALAVLARWGSPGLRAALYGAVAAVMWALVATFIKATTDTLTEFGVSGMFARRPIYALAAGSVAALFLQLASLHVAPLRASQPFLVIVDPMVSIALSTWLFGEHFAVMCAGIVLLTQTAPATMAADIPDGQEGGQHGTASGPARPTAPGFSG